MSACDCSFVVPDCLPVFVCRSACLFICQSVLFAQSVHSRRFARFSICFQLSFSLSVSCMFKCLSIAVVVCLLTCLSTGASVDISVCVRVPACMSVPDGEAAVGWCWGGMLLTFFHHNKKNICNKFAVCLFYRLLCLRTREFKINCCNTINYFRCC